MSSYSVYAERTPRPPFADRNNSSRSSSPAHTAVPLSSSDLSQIYDYTAHRTNTDSTYVPDDSLSPSSMLKEAKAPARSATSTSMDSNNSLSHLPRWKVFRLKVLRMATVERLQWLWGALALFGTMAWISLIPALIFRKNLLQETDSDFNASVYNFFMLATIGTSLTAIWQSLCPFLIRQSQTALFPRIINHPATQTATILISVLMTIFNFFSWMVLASDSAGAKTSCAPEKDRISNRPGYPAQCRGVNVAIIFDVIVFVLWIPISLVIVCGTIERGLWWWGEDDGWAQGELAGGNNMMSEEEFDRKIGMGGSKHIHRRQTVHPDALDDQDPESQRPMTRIQRPKPAFVTPIASQFRSQSTLNVGGNNNNNNNNNNNSNNNEDDSDDEIGGFSPSSYRRHQQQRQQRQRQQQQPSQNGDLRPSLRRQASNTSLSSRLSSFFGTGWNSGQMPPEEPPMPELPSQYRNNQGNQGNQVNQGNQGNQGSQGGSVSFAAAPNKGHQYQPSAKPTTSAMKGSRREKVEKEEEPEPAGLLHGDSYSSQWHSRWS
ncbi:MAG: hypothetical protein J3Q66DRAFT_329314 [Benniella sp.]|nr:MAG: hypothetical protein J3Q66DRAFT_329314 [Benniella sp.]